MTPFAGADATAESHVGLEVGGQPGVYLAVVDKEVGFEIMFETAEVEVGRADRREVVVDNEGLCVKHAGFVEIDLDSRAQA